MASIQNFFLTLLLSVFLSLPLSHSSIHDLLIYRGLPAGLYPKDIKSYTVSESGFLEVFLEWPCLTKFDTMALYDRVVRANLTYGNLTGVEGLSQEEFFLWLPVKEIIVNDPT
ncbi:uncharacterized protein LOC111398063 [Olea europaea var. sylvestris]|uniref:uncharacterized protein LOC111398063 n=1 Tax=Olea europaea var. sylvestris TaxID=158386 RepID=UPI000C1D4472|nr:uncharacterized protein LOC111398063 [Olea europaea var. sylvestris]